ncbi:response regulator transcription factor [[Limnothrix rosea] IAM M-220]|uniref:response regulator transcription factor n=1 Tax=[Limnothrix rosea] IAM M-220 TaxID=454133 RepID=UPI00096494B8|nr:response regulator transcription factor [[Limnothrix rosea] IAM M-220]OKH17769.1 DNA-binding response regulator [[Limnothrix rosea] IAM M-220]
MSDSLNPQTTKLLLIDDDPNLILLVQDYLEFRGYQIMTANNGAEGLKALEADVPDLIICDVMMPEMDGYSFIQEVRKDPKTSWIPVIFLSAKSQIQDRIQGLNQGADVYLVKPFEPEELVAQVESSLSQAKRMLNYSGSGNKSSMIQVPSNVELTPTETKVVSFVSQGLSNREISEKLNVSQRTIESHVSNMLNKTNLNNRTELARWAMDNGLV